MRRIPGHLNHSPHSERVLDSDDALEKKVPHAGHQRHELGK